MDDLEGLWLHSLCACSPPLRLWTCKSASFSSFACCHWVLCCLTISGLLCPLPRAKATFPIFVLLTAQPGMPTGVPPKDQQSDGEQTIVQECNHKRPHRWKTSIQFDHDEGMLSQWLRHMWRRHNTVRGAKQGITPGCFWIQRLSLQSWQRHFAVFSLFCSCVSRFFSCLPELFYSTAALNGSLCPQKSSDFVNSHPVACCTR